MYLVSTSAGEVGIDLDADHMVCDLTTLDSMIQRFGRVNRRGGQGRVASVDVVLRRAAETKDKKLGIDDSIGATEVILKRWVEQAGGGVIDVSPRSFNRLLKDLDANELEGAFAPIPAAPPLSEILLDAWSLTSITRPMPGRPEVTPYLHGLTNDPPETYVAWRKEVSLLSHAAIDEVDLRDWFLACSVQARERLRDRTDRVQKILASLLERHRKTDKGRDFPIVLLNERGEPQFRLLSEIVAKGFDLAYRTIVLPVEANGLDQNGTLDSNGDQRELDVAEAPTGEALGGRRERWLRIAGGGTERYERFITGETATSSPRNLRELNRLTLQEAQEGEENESESRDLLLMVEPDRLALQQAEIAKVKQTLPAHSDLIAKRMDQIALALKLAPPLKEALITAARWHDRGKNRPIWQRFARNPDPSEPLAKSTNYLHGRALGGYRHEFGSLLEAATDDEIQKHTESDLILHLVAAHHGWARPYFERKAWDRCRTTEENEEAAAETMRRFARLQRRFGRWGLAWLESLLRCADIAASKQITGPTNASQTQGVDA